MSHFVRVRPPGMWLVGTTLAAGEMEAFDANLFKALNADDGGVWSPAAQIIIGGSGLRMTGVFETHGDTTIGNAGGDTLTVNATAEFAGTADFAGFVNIGDDIGVVGALTVGGLTTLDTLVVNDNATFNDVVELATDLVVHGDVTVDGSIGVLTTLVAGGFSAGPSSVVISDPVTLSGDGHIKERCVVGADADTTYNVTQYDVIFVPVPPHLTAARIYTLANATDGAKMRVVSYEGDKVTLKRADTSTIAVVSALTGDKSWLDVQWIGGRWEMVAFYVNP